MRKCGKCQTPGHNARSCGATDRLEKVEHGLGYMWWYHTCGQGYYFDADATDWDHRILEHRKSCRGTNSVSGGA